MIMLYGTSLTFDLLLTGASTPSGRCKSSETVARSGTSGVAVSGMPGCGVVVLVRSSTSEVHPRTPVPEAVRIEKCPVGRAADCLAPLRLDERVAMQRLHMLHQVVMVRIIAERLDATCTFRAW